jgi:uncharacterized repeat protein (TIGR03803 family)
LILLNLRGAAPSRLQLQKSARILDERGLSKLNCITKACAILLLWAALAAALPAQTFTMLHSFNSSDGEEPLSGLVQGANGSLYGTTALGGASGQCVDGCGTFFRITLAGTLVQLHDFEQTDGQGPAGGLIQATGGYIYGITANGGANFAGTVFKTTPGRKLTTLYNFCSQDVNGICYDGDEPQAGLVQGTDGKLYGTTIAGGANVYGTVFSITIDGALTTLYNFCSQGGCTDGASPHAGLIQGIDGNFYGTTLFGGAYDNCSTYDPSGCGTVFKITPQGKLTTIYSFCSQSGCTDGSEPYAGLVQGTDGNFYGTTEFGGANNGGTVFKLTPNGTLTTLYSFCSQNDCADGEGPLGLIQGTDGNFYGTTITGGINGLYGTIFNITPGGTLTTLYNFCSQSACADGANPYAGLVQDTNGRFYGTTAYGGPNDCGYSELGCGTVFSLSTGLGPFVAANPGAGKAGDIVGILGGDLTKATNVTFNGTVATFKVISQTVIAAQVPSGATSGAVQVKFPGGTLSSNLPFIVLP